MTAIPITKTIKGPIDPSAKSVIDVLGPQQVRGHHRRKCERNHSRNEDGASEGQSELAKERAGQAALKRDGRVNRGERESHRDDRAHKFTRTLDRRVHARHAFAHVAFDVLDNDNRVIHHQSDRQHDREQR